MDHANANAGANADEAGEAADPTTFGLAAALALLGGAFTLSVGGPAGVAVTCFLLSALLAGVARRPPR
jgi:hypothetical protein